MLLLRDASSLFGAFEAQVALMLAFVEIAQLILNLCSCERLPNPIMRRQLRAVR